MTKITRATQQQFGTTGLVPTGGFGAPAAGDVTTELSTSSSLAAIQAGAAWIPGWLSATIGASKFPTVEDLNALFYAVTTQLAYLFQQGISEYDAGTTYYIGSLCMAVGTTQIYSSITNANAGNALSNGTYWKLLGDLSSLANAGPPVQGNFKNLKILTTSNTASTITADSLIVCTAAGAQIQLKTVSDSYSTATSGANGLDTGSIAASTWYYEYIIYNPTTATAASLISLSATAPTLPSGYTYFARVGAIRTDGSSHLLFKIQYGRKAQYIVGTNPTVLPQMANGTAGNVGTPTWVAIATGNFVPPTASVIRISSIFNANGGQNAMVAPNSSYGAFSSTSNPPPIGFGGGSTTGGATFQVSDLTLESSNIYYASNCATQSIVACLGWEDNL